MIRKNTRNTKKKNPWKERLGHFFPLSPIGFAWKTPDYFREITQEVNSTLILLQANPVKIVTDYKICPELECSAFSLQIRALFSTHSSFVRTRNSHRTCICALQHTISEMMKWGFFNEYWHIYINSPCWLSPKHLSAQSIKIQNTLRFRSIFKFFSPQEHIFKACLVPFHF